MAGYLIKVTEDYRFDSEEEAMACIEEAKENGCYEVAKYSVSHKERKQKGEVVDAWEHVSITKIINDEKEPYSGVTINYGTNF